jgi:hypothetical protein
LEVFGIVWICLNRLELFGTALNRLELSGAIWVCLKLFGTVCDWQGFEASGEVDGHCAVEGVGALASYAGQAVACAPERDLNGQLSEGYCAMAAGEAVLDCCELAGGEDCRQGSAADLALTDCSVDCAERWEPLKQVRRADPVGLAKTSEAQCTVLGSLLRTYKPMAVAN